MTVKREAGEKVNRRSGGKQKGEHGWEIMEGKNTDDLLIWENHNGLKAAWESATVNLFLGIESH